MAIKPEEINSLKAKGEYPLILPAVSSISSAFAVSLETIFPSGRYIFIFLPSLMRISSVLSKTSGGMFSSAFFIFPAHTAHMSFFIHIVLSLPLWYS